MVAFKDERRGPLCERRGGTILSTTPSLEGKKTVKYLGLVSGGAIVGIDIGQETTGAGIAMLMGRGTVVVVEPE